MYKSKRFLFTAFVLVAYLAGVYFFKVNPLEFATGLGIILAPYLAAQSYRKSDLTTKN